MIPIRVEPVETRITNIVEWMIGNTCNFDCSFCHSDFKSGNKRFFDLLIYQSVIDKVIEESKERKVWFKITGGEPTLFPKLIELMKYIKSKGQFTYLITNGSRTMRYWKELKDADCMDIIAFTYHPEQTSDLEHMVQVLDLFSDVPTIVSVNITCPPAYFDKAVDAFKEFKTRCMAYVNLQQVNDDAGMSKYSIEQQYILETNSFSQSDNLYKKHPTNIPMQFRYHSGKIKYVYENNERIDHAINFIKRGEDNFLGFDCFAGVTNIRIDYDTIQRAVCGVGERWSISDPKLFKIEPIRCTQTTCNCTLDIILPKKYK